MSDTRDVTDSIRVELRELAAAARVLLEYYRDSGTMGAPREGALPNARVAAEPEDPWLSKGVQPQTARVGNVPREGRAPIDPSPLPVTSAPAAPSIREEAAPQRTLYALALEGGAARPNASLLGVSVPASRSERHARLAALADEVDTCTRCRLHETRTRTVFARGNPDAELCFVGEGPGADEDGQGLPFVGKAGQLLNRMIHAMGMGDNDVYVCNTVKCRPPNNRKPEPDEMAACRPFLTEQLALVEPKVLVALGGTATEGLLGTRVAITRTRGQWKLYRTTIPLMPTYHPAYLLRAPEGKRDAWADLRAVLERLGRPLPKRDALAPRARRDVSSVS